MVLGRWVLAQRKKHKAGTLAEECVQKLDAMSFQWVVQKRYKQPSHVAGSQKAPPSSQSSSKKNGPAVAMAIRGVSPEEAEWQNFFEELNDYKCKHHHWRIDDIKEENKALATWMRRQRTTETMGTMLKTHHDQLNEIEFFKPKPKLVKPKPAE